MFTKIYQILMDQYGIHQSQYGIYQSHVFHFSISAVFCWKQRAPEIWDHHVIDTWFDLGALPKVESVLTHLGCRNCMCWGPNSYHFHRIWDKLINPIVWVNIPILRIPYHKCRWPSVLNKKRVDRPWQIWASSNRIHLTLWGRSNSIGCWERQIFPESNPGKDRRVPSSLLFQNSHSLDLFTCFFLYIQHMYFTTMYFLGKHPTRCFIYNVFFGATPYELSFNPTFFGCHSDTEYVPLRFQLGICIENHHMRHPWSFTHPASHRPQEKKGSKVGFSVCVWLWKRWWVWA